MTGMQAVLYCVILNERQSHYVTVLLSDYVVPIKIVSRCHSTEIVRYGTLMTDGWLSSVE